MGLIAISLLSIFLGFGNHEFPAETIRKTPLPDAMPFMILFGIFFPAVTGFEAGVSMSGDLKNPNRSLPIGAMSAIIVGLVVVLGPLLALIGSVIALAEESEREITRKFFQGSFYYYWLMVWGVILAGSGLWWSMLAGFLLRKQQLLDKLIYPFGNHVTRKRLYKLTVVGLTLLISGTIAGLLIIMKYAR